MGEIDVTEGVLRSRCRQLEERLAAVELENRSLRRSLRAVASTAMEAADRSPTTPGVVAAAAS